MNKIIFRRLTLNEEGATRYGENKKKMNLNRFCVGWFAHRIIEWAEEFSDSIHEIIDFLSNLFA